MYRVPVVRGGYLAAEWNLGPRGSVRLNQASVAKSVFSCVLGILVHKKKIPSADARTADYYPEAMEAAKGRGPQTARYVIEKDRARTFRQLISSTYGYTKPGQVPGMVFNYQTFGMSIPAHAMAKIHGYWDVKDPERSPGLRPLRACAEIT